MPSGCAVPGCDYNQTPNHRFPHPVKDYYKRFGEWLSLAGRQDLMSMDPMKVYEGKRICTRHFSSTLYLPGTTKLKKNVFPDLHLPVWEESVLEGPEHSTPEGRTRFGEESLLSSTATQSVREESVLEGPVHSTPEGGCVTRFGEESLLSSTATQSVREESVLEGPVHSTPEGGCVTRFGEESLLSSTATQSESCLPLMDTPGTPQARRSLFPDSDVACSGRRGILHKIGVTKVKELTPKAKYLYRASQRLQRRILHHSKVLISARKRLKLADKATKQGWVSDFSSLPQTVSSFLACQFREASKKSKGRRFTLDEKVLALSLLKRSGRAYNFLSKVFLLPSRRTLLRLLSRLSFSAGINNAMFDHLAFTVQETVKPKDRHCILMFDEMSLTPHLQFQEHLGIIEGFEDVGWERRPRLADKALVFMVRGLRRKYKQPVLYAFLSGTVKTPDLCRLIKDVVFHLGKAGFNVCATVCDQGSTNVAAINRLCTETRLSVLRSGGEYRGEYFTVNGMEVIPLFDPPHLLKGVRNALLNNDLRFCHQGVNYVASWRHILQAYAIDSQMDGRDRLTPNITDFHVLPNKIKKMKVKYCTQVFSRTLSAHIGFLVRRPVATEDIDPEAMGTSKLLGFFDELFDSVNGKGKAVPVNKPLLAEVCSTSKHVAFWGQSIKVLESMAFLHGKKESRTPSLKNWSRTLRNMITLWNKLKGLGFKSLAVGYLNQDPLENKFGAIRSYGFRNVYPTCSNFIGAYKSLLLDNMMAPHSIGANCEEDDCKLLDNLKSYLINSGSSGTFTASSEIGINEVGSQIDYRREGETAEDSIMSSAASPIYHFMKQLGPVECTECRSMQQAATSSASADVLEAQREGVVIIPSATFREVYRKCRDAVSGVLPNVGHRPQFLNCLRAVVSQINLQHITCHHHHNSYKERFNQAVVSLTVTAWVNSVNRYVRGKDTTQHEKMDTIQNLAYKTHVKRRKHT